MHAGGPRVAVHVRAARIGGRLLHELTCRVADLQEETGAWAVVNDRADVALTSGARGVQLTSRSMTAADAHCFAPRLAIGASVHSAADARSAADGEQLASEHTLPIIAIGGVKPQHVASLRAAGAYGVAVIRGVWSASDAGAAVIDYLSAHGAPGGR